MVVSSLKRHWVRAAIIAVMFLGAGLVPTVIETQLLPIAQVSSLLDNFTDDQTGELNFQAVFDMIDFNELRNQPGGITLDPSSTSSKTILKMKLLFENKESLAYYPMKIPQIKASIYYKAGLPYTADADFLFNFKESEDLVRTGGVVPTPTYDYRAWINVMDLEIPQEYNIQKGSTQSVEVILTLKTNGEEWNALGQMLGTLIRDQGIGQDMMYLKGSVSLMGIPIPIDLAIPSFYLSDAEEAGIGGGMGGLMDMITPLMDSIFVSDTNNMSFNIADLRNYDDQNQNMYRDWNDTTADGIKQSDEEWLEPLLENGTLSADLFLPLNPVFTMNDMAITIPESTWNLQEEADPDTGRIYNQSESPKSHTIWSTSEQQLLLYLPESAAEALNESYWKNRVVATLGFIHNRTLNMGDVIRTNELTQYSTYDEAYLPVIMGADLRLTGDARVVDGHSFTPGDAVGSLLPQLLGGQNLSVGVIGNIKVNLGQMPLALNLQIELQDLNISSLMGGETQSTSVNSLSTSQSILDSISNPTDLLSSFMQLDRLMFNGLALDTFAKIVQANLSIDAGLFFPFGFYLPETIEEAEQFIGIGGGPIQMFNDTKPSDWDTLNVTNPIYSSWDNLTGAQNAWYEDHIIMNLSIDGESLTRFISETLVTLGQMNGGQGIAYHYGNAFSNTLFGPYGKVKEDLLSGIIPNGETMKTALNVTLDQSKLNLTEVIPDFGPGLDGMLQEMGIDTRLLDYIRQGLKDIGNLTMLDLLDMDMYTFIKLLYNPEGAMNDLFEYMVNISVFEKFSISSLIDSLLGEDSLLSGTSSGLMSGMDQILVELPNMLQATGIDFNSLLPDIIDYLKLNISSEKGIKPFELIDIIMSGSSGDAPQLGEGMDLMSMMSGLDPDGLVELVEDLQDFMKAVNIFDLLNTAVGNVIPFVDYMNRSKLFSKEILLPLIADLLLTETGEPMELDLPALLNALSDFVTAFLKEDVGFEHMATNVFPLLQSAESTIPVTFGDNSYFENSMENGFNAYPLGTGNFTADTPPYDNLRLISQMALGMTQSGMDAEMVWKLLEELGIIDFGTGDDPNADPLASLSAYLPIAGYFVPSGEWLSFLRELGIWSPWEGFTHLLLGIPILGTYDVSPLLGKLLNLERFLATGALHLMQDGLIFLDMGYVLGFPLCVFENASYGNPYYYQPGYDTSHNT
ncbi:MAG: hypothetical protein FK734_07700, partial [Asgard group archaeon]|nr:hypothetical protein [Asgard group archaeon]